MRTITLSESVLRTHSLHFRCSGRPKSLRSYLFSLNSRSQKHNSKLSHQHPCLVFSRCSRRLCENTSGELFGQFLGKAWENYGDIELGCLDCRTGKATKQLLHNLDHGNVLDKSPAKNNCKMEDQRARSIPLLDISVGSLLKFVLVFGFLTLQGSQQAVAGSDVAIGLQLNSSLGELGDISTGFASAFLLIFFSELGDKTFFIAALLAARNSGAVVFVGTFGALAAMTIISVVLGRTFHYVDEILPFRFGETDLPIDDIAAVCLLVYFGVSTLLEANSGDGLKAEEEQKEAELAVSEFSGNGAGILSAASTVISTFLLVFVAEWGDKSFFSTIGAKVPRHILCANAILSSLAALAAASSPLGVIGGALAGHGVATLLAVLGGSFLGTFLSEKVIAYIGGVLFLVFAVVTLIEIVS